MLKRLRRAHTIGQHLATTPGLLNPAALEAARLRHRSLADRAGRCFTSLVFTCETRQDLKDVSRSLLQRCRLTDEVGLAQPLRVVALLPETTSHGARRLVDDVLNAVPANARITVSTHVYPPERDDGSKDNDHTPHHGHRQPAARPHNDKPADRFAPTPGTVHAWDMHALATDDRHGMCFGTSLPRWKRAADVLLASAGLVALSPLLALAAAAVKLDSPGPVLFHQWRGGMGGRPFRICKFRTMYTDAEARKAELLHLNEQQGPAFKLRHDPRITRIGRVLRATSIDELPQLFNVLAGQMTLVGPRPLPLSEVAAYDRWHHQRHDVPPGLTCTWQIYGRNRVGFDDWVRMDVRYIRRRSFAYDMLLILKTIPAVFRMRGY